jgi:conjugative relaxase-like TrwC/TraI family protein
VWWALTGDHRLLEAHDVAVTAALAHLERFGSTTRIRAGGGRLHPDTNGLTIATFRQTTSRADDPQIHTHAVISAKVQTGDRRWYALDARYLKRHQRMLGGLYQSVLRAELTHRLGVDWRPITNGQAEIAGIPDELLAVFSKRTADIDTALADKLDGFRQREGREASRWERAALTREASADTRSRKSGHGAADLATRWRKEAADAGWSAELLDASIDQAAAQATRPEMVVVPDVIEAVSQQRSSWARADVLQTICDLHRPVAHQSGHGWAGTLERATDRVIARLVDLDPPNETTRRSSDSRSVWIEPTAPRFTSEPVLAQEEEVITWAMAAQADPPAPSTTVNGDGLDRLQADAAAAVAGDDHLVLVVGPAGAGKTRMLSTAGEDLHARGRIVFAVAPTAKAERSSATPAFRPPPSPSCYVNGTAPTGHRYPSSGWPPGRRCSSTRPACCRRPQSTRSCRSSSATGGGSPSSVIPDSSKVSVVAGCSPSCAPMAASNSSNASTASPMRGRQPRRCSCDAVTRQRSTPTRRTAASSPARSPSTSPVSPPHGSIKATAVAASPSWPRRTTTSTPSTALSRPPVSPPATSTATLRHH